MESTSALAGVYERAIKRLDADDWPDDAEKSFARLAYLVSGLDAEMRIAAEADAASLDPAAGGSLDSLAEKLQNLIAKLLERLQEIAEGLRDRGDVSFTISASVPPQVSLTLTPK